jgi:dTDP-4-amino-4,6-dideoxygalactose transaminase
MQAAIGVGQLNKLDQIIEGKRAILSWYRLSEKDLEFRRLRPQGFWKPLGS